jgi:hypothetical protein
MRALSLVVAAAVLGAGCSSHYMPRALGRVAVMVQAGQPVYVRDGQVIPQGFAGANLESAVAGNPAAMAAARHFHEGWRDAIIEVVVGGLLMGGGIGALEYEAFAASNTSNRAVVAGASAAVVGMCLMLYGGFEAQDAQTYQWDAINIFNDGGAPGPALPVTPGAWSSNDAARATLQMR